MKRQNPSLEKANESSKRNKWNRKLKVLKES
jgi:hypothetical protein